MLFVVILAMVSIVVHSVFVFTLVLMLQLGTMALLYIMSTHYTTRGRDSYGREFCGCWIVSFNSDYSYNVWLIGATLS